MRIVHIVESLDPQRGGPPAVAARIAAAQAQLGHDVSLVSYKPTPDRSAAVERAYATVPNLDKVRMEWLPPERGPWYWVALLGRHRLRETLPGADVVHLHGVWEPLLRIAAAIARRKRVPYVVRPCGMLDPWSLSQKSLKKRLALRFAYRKMLDRAAFLHVLNDDERRLIEPLGLRCPAAVIPNGMFLEEVDPLPPAGTFRRTHPELGDAPFVLFLSRLHFKKGLDYLADAFAQVAAKVPDARLVVAGPDGGALGDFERQVQQLGIVPRVHVVGPLYGPEKIAAMVDAFCFCLPSRQEGFSVAITEALACRLPVVISEACHFPDVAEVGAGRVVDLEPTAIANAVIEVLQNRHGAVEMGEAGRKLVASRYTWPQIARLTVARYEELATTAEFRARAVAGRA